MNRYLPILFLCSALFISAQQPLKPTSSEIYEDLKKLNFLGTALYIAAHPDDENTALISYLANDVKARTGYLSLTRGDGGQNLIGPEIRESLGVIRTQELLAARRTDGGEQLFTRANDFGYSKHPDETLEIWNKEAVLSDVVLAIRKFKPDIIINRFNHRPETFGSTHGHHSSSAVLSQMAFDLVGDESKFSSQLERVDVWQPRRLFFNTFWWFYGSKEKFDQADKSNMIELEIGTYYSSYGLSNNEISSLSRSMHKSQGFGSTGSRGKQSEYLEILKGDLPQDPKNLFDGINTTWSRVHGGEVIGEILEKVVTDFDFKYPVKSVKGLLKAYHLIENIEDNYWRIQKTKEIKELILACSGLYIEAVASEPSATPGSKAEVAIEVIDRGKVHMRLAQIELNPLGVVNREVQHLRMNEKLSLKLEGTIPMEMEYTSPYWLRKKGTVGMYNVENKNLIGVPETPRALMVKFTIAMGQWYMDFEKEVVYKRNDPVKGEVYQPFEIVPEATASMDDKVFIFASAAPKDVVVKVQAGISNLHGKVQLCHPNNWDVSPEYHDIKIAKKGGEVSVIFKVTPPAEESEGLISPIVKVNGEMYSNEMIKIVYDHIPTQSVLQPSESKVVRLNIKKKGEFIGYIQGAGDEIPASLTQLGYTVTELKEDEITYEKIKHFDAIVVGVRAYNTNDKVKFYQKELHEYVRKGGTMMVQYNTSRGLKVTNVAPLPLKLGRGRVADENAKVTILSKDHEVMQYPNQISEKDFDGWVQERGLYFPSEWSDDFTPLLSMHDTGEKELKGSLLVAKLGKGYFIYTGLSFFRELPAGVPGAYRLYTNLLSVGKNKQQ